MLILAGTLHRREIRFSIGLLCLNPYVTVADT